MGFIVMNRVMGFKVYTVHDWFDVERLSPDDVKHYKTKELLVDYDSYAKLEAERDALRDKLIETAQELNFMIDLENTRLLQNISATDETPPDYFDAQTVQEAMILANKTSDRG